MKVKDKRLIRNAAKCPDCGAVLESKHRHDFVSCSCGNFVDGGLDYLRGGGPAWNRMIDLSEYEDYEREEFAHEANVRLGKGKAAP